MTSRITLMFGFLILSLSLSYSSNHSHKQKDNEGTYKQATYLVGTRTIDSVTANSKKYQCPPCGCPNDGLIYTTSGKCPLCKMRLTEKPQGFSQRIDKTIAPILKGVKLYVIYAKLIYPIFVISILSSLFLLFLMIKRKSLNVFLIAIILSLALFAFQNQLYDTSRGHSSHWRSLFTPFSTILAIGPLLFFYIKGVLSTSFKWKKLYWLHFLPAFLMFLFYSSILFSSKTVQEQFMSSPHDTTFSHLEQMTAMLSLAIYLIFALILFKKWKKRSHKHTIWLTAWLRRFFIGMELLLLGWSGMLFIDFWLYDFELLTINYNPLWYSITVVLLWLFTEIFLNPKFFLLKKRRSFYIGGNETMTDEQIHRYKTDLIRLMQRERLYTDPDLSLSKLAKIMGLNSRYLSIILNNILDKTFYDFINQYRIEEAKSLLRNPNYRKLTIEAISNKSGFKSKSSFNSAFKKYVKMTPREYISTSKD